MIRSIVSIVGIMMISVFIMYVSICCNAIIRIIIIISSSSSGGSGSGSGSSSSIIYVRPSEDRRGADRCLPEGPNSSKK